MSLSLLKQTQSESKWKQMYAALWSAKKQEQDDVKTSDKETSLFWNGQRTGDHLKKILFTIFNYK